MLNLVFIAVILLVGQQGTVSATGEILLQPSIALGVDIACVHVSKVVMSRKNQVNLPAPPKKLKATGKNTSACNAAQTTKANHTLK